MKKKIIVLALAVTLLAGCNNNPKLKDGKEVIATMKGNDITVEELYNSLKEKYGAEELINLVDEIIVDKEYETTDEIKSKINETFDSQKKQYEDFYQVDFNVILADSGYTEESYRRILLTSYKQELLVKDYIKNLITEDEIKKYYEDNMYGKITARHILIMPKKTENMSDQEKEAKKKEALDLANSLIKRLDNGEDFATLAKEFSEDTVSAENGGLLEPFDNNSGFVEEFWKASVELEVGKYSKTPVESQYGYHIILKEKEDERPSLEEKKEDIKNSIAEDKLSGSNASELISKALYEARKKYDLDIKDEDIKKIYDENTEKIKD